MKSMPNHAQRSTRPPRHRLQGGDDDGAADARSSESQSSGFHPESVRLHKTREVKELLDNASNEGSDVRGRRHRRHQPKWMQCFRPEFTQTQVVEAYPRRRRRRHACIAAHRRHTKPTLRRRFTQSCPAARTARAEQQKNLHVPEPPLRSPCAAAEQTPCGRLLKLLPETW